MDHAQINKNGKIIKDKAAVQYKFNGASGLRMTCTCFPLQCGNQTIPQMGKGDIRWNRWCKVVCCYPVSFALLCAPNGWTPKI